MVLRKAEYKKGDVVMLNTNEKQPSEILSWSEDDGMNVGHIDIVNETTTEDVFGVLHQRIRLEGNPRYSHPSSKFDYIGKL
jgi:hypothetical protein